MSFPREPNRTASWPVQKPQQLVGRAAYADIGDWADDDLVLASANRSGITDQSAAVTAPMSRVYLERIDVLNFVCGSIPTDEKLILRVCYDLPIGDVKSGRCTRAVELLGVGVIIPLPCEF